MEIYVLEMVILMHTMQYAEPILMVRNVIAYVNWSHFIHLNKLHKKPNINEMEQKRKRERGREKGKEEDFSTFRIVRARNVKPTKPKYSIRAHIFFDLAFFFFVLSLYFQYGILSNYIVGYLSLSLWFRLIRNSLGSISIAYPSILLPVIVQRH